MICYETVAAMPQTAPTLLSSEFVAISKRHVLFHFGFFVISSLVLLAIVLFLPFLATSFLIGITIACMFFTFLSYFVLRLYFKEQKSIEYIQLRNDYLRQCKEELRYSEGNAEHHLSLANSSWRMALLFNAPKESLYTVPQKLRVLIPFITALSNSTHWYDFHFMKELFLVASIDEHIKLVKCRPTNLEAHAALANAYVMLAQHYLPPEGYVLPRLKIVLKPSRKFLERLKTKFLKSQERAIAEFFIVRDYAPHDPWVYEQLAFTYKDLGMAEKEVEQYEVLMKLCPEKKEPFYKAGVLYFKQGHNAKGLKIYEILKGKDASLAQELIAHYGAYSEHDPYSVVL